MPLIEKLKRTNEEGVSCPLFSDKRKNLNSIFHAYSTGKDGEILKAENKASDAKITKSFKKTKIPKNMIDYFGSEYIDGNTFKSEQLKNGICEGLTLRFIYLYLATVPRADHPVKAIWEIAKLFENGGDEKACLMQALDFLDLSKGMHEFMGLKIVDVFDEKKLRHLVHQNTVFSSDQEIRTKARSDYKEIQNGAYFISFFCSWDKPLENPLNPGEYLVENTGSHDVAYFKINQKLGMLWDPNVGLIPFMGEDHFSNILCFLSDKYHLDELTERELVGKDELFYLARMQLTDPYHNDSIKGKNFYTPIRTLH